MVCGILIFYNLLLQPQAREKAENGGFPISVAKTSFKANTKALAENEGEGLAKVTICSFVDLALILYSGLVPL